MDELLALDPGALTPLASHPRCAWSKAGCDLVLVHGRTDLMTGAQEGLAEPKARVAKKYAAAKTNNDMEAAFDLIDLLYDERTENALVDRVMAAGRAPIYVRPYPAFADPHLIDCDAPADPGPRNAIPYAFAARLQSSIGGELDASIVQAARVGRTKLNRFERYLWQPSFVGDVRTDRPYVLVDDAFAIGGTLAALHSYIAMNGGTVVAVTTLCQSSGRSVPFALTDQARHALYDTYSDDLAIFWKEVIGHEAECLTDMEGSFLVQWARENHAHRGAGAERLLALRDRLITARNCGK